MHSAFSRSDASRFTFFCPAAGAPQLPAALTASGASGTRRSLRLQFRRPPLCNANSRFTWDSPSPHGRPMNWGLPMPNSTPHRSSSDQNIYCLVATHRRNNGSCVVATLVATLIAVCAATRPAPAAVEPPHHQPGNTSSTREGTRGAGDDLQQSQTNQPTCTAQCDNRCANQCILLCTGCKTFCSTYIYNYY
jgi:hypothetical protein